MTAPPGSRTHPVSPSAPPAPPSAISKRQPPHPSRSAAAPPLPPCGGPPYLELAERALHLLRGHLEGGRRGDHLGQHAVVVAADDVAGGHGAVHADAGAAGHTVRLQAASVRLRGWRRGSTWGMRRVRLASRESRRGNPKKPSGPVSPDSISTDSTDTNVTQVTRA